MAKNQLVGVHETSYSKRATIARVNALAVPRKGANDACQCINLSNPAISIVSDVDVVKRIYCYPIWPI